MAKKRARKPAKTKRNPGPRFVLRVTNLKFIGAAIDEAISDLKVIRQGARNKSAVTRKIEALESLHTKTSRICPQSWWIPFES